MAAVGVGQANPNVNSKGTKIPPLVTEPQLFSSWVEGIKVYVNDCYFRDGSHIINHVTIEDDAQRAAAIQNLWHGGNPVMLKIDQNNFWSILHQACMNNVTIQPILTFAAENKQNIEYATLAWKEIIEFFDPKTEAAGYQKLETFREEIKHFRGAWKIYSLNMKRHAAICDKAGQSMPIVEFYSSMIDAIGDWAMQHQGNHPQRLWKGAYLELARIKKSEIDWTKMNKICEEHQGLVDRMVKRTQQHQAQIQNPVPELAQMPQVVPAPPGYQQLAFNATYTQPQPP